MELRSRFGYCVMSLVGELADLQHAINREYAEMSPEEKAAAALASMVYIAEEIEREAE